MRVTTAFKRLLRLPGASVIDVSFGGEGVIVTVRLRRRRRVCSRCGQTGGQIHDRRVKRWRHLDLGANRCVIECELRRLRCPDCGAQLEPVPWARPGSRYTRDFEDVVAWLAQQMAKTPITGLLRIGWDTVGRIVERVIADHLDERRLDGLVAIGVDEISYRRGQRYLTASPTTATGAIVWCAPGRNSATLQAFFDELGERKALDPGGLDRHERRVPARDPRRVPTAEICFDPFHVVRLAQRATDQVRRDEWNAHERSHTPTGRWVKGTRWSLLKAPEADDRPARHARRGPAGQPPLYRAFLLREELRLLYHLDDPALAPGASRRLAGLGIALATRAVRQARPHAPRPPRRHPRRHPPRPLQRPPRRPQQQDPPDQPPQLRLPLRRALIALVYLCCTGIVIDLPR